jgi:hypothetical protein
MRASLPTGIILDVLVCENVLHEPVSPTGVKEESPLRVAPGPNTFLRRKSRAAKLRHSPACCSECPRPPRHRLIPHGAARIQFCKSPAWPQLLLRASVRVPYRLQHRLTTDSSLGSRNRVAEFQQEHGQGSFSGRGWRQWRPAFLWRRPRRQTRRLCSCVQQSRDSTYGLNWTLSS